MYNCLNNYIYCTYNVIESNSANVCGSMGISRILESKRGEMNYENLTEKSSVIDEKSSRIFNSKQVPSLNYIFDFLGIHLNAVSPLGNDSR